MIKTEVALKAQARHRLGRVGDGNLFFGFDGLVHALAPRTLRHRSAGKLVDDDDFAVHDDVLFAREVKLPGEEGLPGQLQPPVRSAPDSTQWRATGGELFVPGLG